MSVGRDGRDLDLRIGSEQLGVGDSALELDGHPALTEPTLILICSVSGHFEKDGTLEVRRSLALFGGVDGLLL